MTSLALRRPVAASSTPYPQHDLEVLGMRLRYIDVPARNVETDAPLLLIHGHASRLEEYGALMDTLTARRRVLVLDLPGTGYSDKPDRQYSFRFYEDTLLAFMDACSLREPIHLAGGSLGGCLVLRLAHREPERFSRLAAWAPGGSWEPKRWTALGARLMRRLPFVFWPTLRAQSRFWYRSDWEGRDDALIDAFRFFREVYDRRFHRMYWEMAAAQVEDSLFHRANQIAHETYLAYGEHDTGLGMNQGVPRLAAMMPRATLRRFDGARHALASEEAEVLALEIDRFVAGEALPAPSAARPTTRVVALKEVIRGRSAVVRDSP